MNKARVYNDQKHRRHIKPNIFIEYNLWIVLVVVIALVVTFFIRRDELIGFNPETDTSSEECDYIIQSPIDNEYYCMNYYNKEEGGSAQGHQLKKWRSKTKCELNPNDEGCVCDEYKDNIVGSWKQCYDGNCMEGDIILINDSITHQETKINHHSNCIKAHENPKKTLSDLNCGELTEEYLKEEKDYCPWGQFWFLCFGQWGNRYGSKEGILMEYLGRCYGRL